MKTYHIFFESRRAAYPHSSSTTYWTYILVLVI